MDAVRNAFYTLMLMGILLMGFTFIDLTGNVNYQVAETLYGGELIYLHSKNMVLTGNSRINVPGTLPPLIMNVNGKTQPALTFQVNASGNMKIIPHLYDWSFDGVDDYVVVGLQPDGSGTPFTVYGWSEITIEELMYPVWPKANTLFSLFSIIGDWWSSEPATTYETDNRADYTRLMIRFATRSADGTRVLYSYNMITYVNSWVHIVRRFTSARGLSYWVNGKSVASWTVPSTETTIIEWNPNTATYPRRYQRFVLGANMEFSGWMTIRYGYVRIYNRALNNTEISDVYGNHILNASGLKLFLDATFYDSSLGKYVDLSGNGNHGTPYNGVARVISDNRHVTRLLNAASDGKAHFLIPEKYIYRILDADNNILAEGLATSISDVALDVNGTVTLQLTPPWNNVDLYNAYYGSPPTGEAEGIVLQHPNGTLHALFDASTYDGAVIYDVKNGLTATPQYISIVDAANPALRIVRTSFLDNKYLWLHYLPAGMEIKIVYGQAQYTYRYNGTAIAFQLPEKPVKAKINYYHADKKLYIVLEKSSISIPVPGMPIQVGSVIGFINRLWGDAAFIVPMLLPVSIYLKKRSLTLTAGSLALISAINMLLFPQSISIILLWASTILIGLILYM
ncbi:MAG: hypothetical protein QXO22_08575, partial [Thermosphaera sp.]